MGKGSRADTTLMRGAQAGAQMVFWFAVGFLVGRWLDHRWHTTPYLTAAGILLGFGGGLWSAYRTLMPPTKKD
jgi:F0F1-type ATP synthase assembly protein I